MTPSQKLLCERFGQAVRKLVKDHVAERRPISSFVSELLALEQEAITPAGLVMSATDTVDGWICFSLHVADTSQVCAQFEFRLETGEFRQTT